MARPVTLSAPSWRIGRVPMTLYFFVSRFEEAIGLTLPLMTEVLGRDRVVAS